MEVNKLQRASKGGTLGNLKLFVHIFHQLCVPVDAAFIFVESMILQLTQVSCIVSQLSSQMNLA